MSFQTHPKQSIRQSKKQHSVKAYRNQICALYFYVNEQRMKKADTTKRVQEKRKGFTKKIGNTTYDVSFHYSRQSRESMNDKIIRLIENDMQGMKKN